MPSREQYHRPRFSHTHHRPTRITESGGLAEIRTELIVRGDPLLRGVIEQIEDVHEKLGASRDAEGDRPRDAEIEQRLRRQPARAARLEEDPLVTLRQSDLRCRRPRLAAEVLHVGRDDESGPGHVDAAHDPEHVRSIVWQPAARVGETVRILPECDVTESQAGVDRQQISHRDGVAHEPRGGDEHAARQRWIARDGLKRRPALSMKRTPVGMIMDSRCSPFSI